MRMWKVNPRVMCSKHLRGEHVEMHMFVGTINKGISIKGYIAKGLVEVEHIRKRHDEIAEELVRRGGCHQSPLPNFESRVIGRVSTEDNLRELARRCSECRRLQEEYENTN